MQTETRLDTTLSVVGILIKKKTTTHLETSLSVSGLLTKLSETHLDTSLDGLETILKTQSWITVYVLWVS